MKVEWDWNKAESNLAKHGVDFADAVFVLEDINAITIEDSSSNEERFITVGLDCIGRVLVVVYTIRNDSIRLISARKATKHERKQYENDL